MNIPYFTQKAFSIFTLLIMSTGILAGYSTARPDIAEAETHSEYNFIQKDTQDTVGTGFVVKQYSDTQGTYSGYFTWSFDEDYWEAFSWTTVNVDISEAGTWAIHGLVVGTWDTANTLNFVWIDNQDNLVNQIDSLQFAKNLTDYHKVFADKDFLSVRLNFTGNYTLNLVDLIAFDKINDNFTWTINDLSWTWDYWTWLTNSGSIWNFITSLKENIEYTGFDNVLENNKAILWEVFEQDKDDYNETTDKIVWKYTFYHKWYKDVDLDLNSEDFIVIKNYSDTRHWPNWELGYNDIFVNTWAFVDKDFWSWKNVLVDLEDLGDWKIYWITLGTNPNANTINFTWSVFTWSTKEEKISNLTWAIESLEFAKNLTNYHNIFFPDKKDSDNSDHHKNYLSVKMNFTWGKSLELVDLISLDKPWNQSWDPLSEVLTGYYNDWSYWTETNDFTDALIWMIQANIGFDNNWHELSSDGNFILWEIFGRPYKFKGWETIEDNDIVIKNLSDTDSDLHNIFIWSFQEKNFGAWENVLVDFKNLGTWKIYWITLGGWDTANKVIFAWSGITNSGSLIWSIQSLQFAKNFNYYHKVFEDKDFLSVRMNFTWAKSLELVDLIAFDKLWDYKETLTDLSLNWNFWSATWAVTDALIWMIGANIDYQDIDLSWDWELILWVVFDLVVKELKIHSFVSSKLSGSWVNYTLSYSGTTSDPLTGSNLELFEKDDSNSSTWTVTLSGSTFEITELTENTRYDYKLSLENTLYSKTLTWSFKTAQKINLDTITEEDKTFTWSVSLTGSVASWSEVDLGSTWLVIKSDEENENEKELEWEIEVKWKIKVEWDKDWNWVINPPRKVGTGEIDKDTLWENIKDKVKDIVKIWADKWISLKAEDEDFTVSFKISDWKEWKVYNIHKSSDWINWTDEDGLTCTLDNNKMCEFETNSFSYFAPEDTSENWACWDADWETFSSTPGSNLCSAWNPTTVSLNWTTYSWTCNWTKWWDNDSCSATYDAPTRSSGRGWGGGSSLLYATSQPTNTAVEAENTDAQEKAVNQFKDIQETHWAASHIGKLTDKNVFTKTDNFRPDDSMNRAEIVKAISVAFNLKETTDVNFTDVEQTQWYYQYLQKAVASGVIDADWDVDTFRPSDSANRAEAIKIILAASEADISETKVSLFDDVSQNAWFAKFVNFAKNKNIVQWYGDNTFWPSDTVTRSQVAKMISVAIDTL